MKKEKENSDERNISSNIEPKARDVLIKMGVKKVVMNFTGRDLMNARRVSVSKSKSKNKKTLDFVIPETIRKSQAMINGFKLKSNTSSLIKQMEKHELQTYKLNDPVSSMLRDAALTLREQTDVIPSNIKMMSSLGSIVSSNVWDQYKLLNDLNNIRYYDQFNIDKRLWSSLSQSVISSNSSLNIMNSIPNLSIPAVDLLILKGIHSTITGSEHWALATKIMGASDAISAFKIGIESMHEIAAENDQVDKELEEYTDQLSGLYERYGEEIIELPVSQEIINSKDDIIVQMSIAIKDLQKRDFEQQQAMEELSIEIKRKNKWQTAGGIVTTISGISNIVTKYPEIKANVPLIWNDAKNILHLLIKYLMG